MKKFLVCTDGSNYADVCYEYAIWLARRLDADIEVLYVSDMRQFEISMVADFSGSLGVQPYQSVYSQMQDLEKEKVTVIRKQTEDFFKKHHFLPHLKFSNRTGDLIDAFEEFEDDPYGIDLIFIGKQGENASKATEHFGSTLERVTRSSKKPCFIAPKAFNPVQKILLAYDGSTSTNKALQFLERINKFKDLEVHLVTVDDDYDQDAASAVLSHAKKALESSGYTIKCQLLQGDVEDNILQYIKQEKIELMVMGAYGDSALKHLFVGSTTTELVRRCTVPILLFR
ncbi:MAG: hypothetical protein A2Y14_04965 [Verrucomicrobia bacterium GWF2_51_19]|nr:MAG: hypothetical protein A2Y14_04965 [Verrucomicrobia bacterium GWF2_51_19]